MSPTWDPGRGPRRGKEQGLTCLLWNVTRATSFTNSLLYPGHSPLFDWTMLLPRPALEPENILGAPCVEYSSPQPNKARAKLHGCQLHQYLTPGTMIK